MYWQFTSTVKMLANNMYLSQQTNYRGRYVDEFSKNDALRTLRSELGLSLPNADLTFEDCVPLSGVPLCSSSRWHSLESIEKNLHRV